MKTFLDEVNSRINGVPLQNCFHCYKCSSGCPMANAMEYNSNQMIRMAQLGQKEKLLKSSAIWLCVSCETCVTRCPNEVDIPRMIDVFREMALEEGYVPAEKEVIAFHESFLDSVKLNGRINEPLMIASYKLKTGSYFKDLAVGLKMLLKGKLSLLSPRTRNRTSVRRIFRHTLKS